MLDTEFLTLLSQAPHLHSEFHRNVSSQLAAAGGPSASNVKVFIYALLVKGV